MTPLESQHNKIKPTDFYRFHRICRLEECETEIHTNRKDHIFCRKAHQQEWWKRHRGARGTASAQETRRLAKEVEELKETVKELKASQPTK